MAATSYGVNAPEAVKLWSKKLAREALKATQIGSFIGRGKDSLIQLKEETSKEAGDRVRITMREQLDGEGVTGDGTLEGNEESLSTFTDDVLIDQLRHAVRSEGKMSEERIPFNHREEAMEGLRDWFAGRMDRAFFLQGAGYTGGVVEEHGEKYNGTATYAGNNDPIVPNSEAHTRADASAFVGSGAADEDLVAADTMKLSYLDDLVAIAETQSPVIRPIRIKGEKHYTMFLHPYQVRDLRKDAGADEWKDIQKAAMQGGEVSKNPIFTGALGMYNNVVLHKSSRVPQGVNSTTSAAIANTRRSFLAGAQAFGLGFGQGHSFNNYDWHEELFDYGNALGVAGACIFGLKKMRFNSKDFGTLVMSTYAAAP